MTIVNVQPTKKFSSVMKGHGQASLVQPLTADKMLDADEIFSDLYQVTRILISGCKTGYGSHVLNMAIWSTNLSLFHQSHSSSKILGGLSYIRELLIDVAAAVSTISCQAFVSINPEVFQHAIISITTLDAALDDDITELSVQIAAVIGNLDVILSLLGDEKIGKILCEMCE